MLVNRDPFTRKEIHRTLQERNTPGTSCSWCGNECRKKLYEYRCESDGGRSTTYKGLFCSNDCFYSYHNL